MWYPLILFNFSFNLESKKKKNEKNLVNHQPQSTLLWIDSVLRCLELETSESVVWRLIFLKDFKIEWVECHTVIEWNKSIVFKPAVADWGRTEALEEQMMTNWLHTEPNVWSLNLSTGSNKVCGSHSLNRHHAWTQTGSNNTSNHYSIKLSTKVDVWVKKTKKKPGRFRLSVCQQMVGHKAERKQQRYFIFWIPQQWLDQTSEKWKGWWVIRLVLI